MRRETGFRSRSVRRCALRSCSSFARGWARAARSSSGRPAEESHNQVIAVHDFSGQAQVDRGEGMATSETRHAAWRTERQFAVRLLPEGGPPTELADGLTEFFDAFDLAFEWLNREDPARTGTATLAIVETCDGVSEEVWTYPPLPSNGEELTARLGFNPANWVGAPGYSKNERTSRLRQRVGADEPHTDADEAPWQQIERAVRGETAPHVEPSVEPRQIVEPVDVIEPV